MFPDHPHTEMEFYVDGQAAFEAMADALESATKEILIGVLLSVLLCLDRAGYLVHIVVLRGCVAPCLTPSAERCLLPLCPIFTLASLCNAADWILSPEIYLRRGPRATVADRLDQILLRQAVKGVKV